MRNKDMEKTTLHQLSIGRIPLKANTHKCTNTMVHMDGEYYFKISHVDQIPPFFMSIVSDSDHWLFIYSNGALTAGRKNEDRALFPYYTDDKILDSHNITGSKSIFMIEKDDQRFLWEPFSDNYPGIYEIERNLYKNSIGNKVVFEEINHDLKMCFRYSWRNSDRFGFVKKSHLQNLDEQSVSVELLDGIQNLVPYGVSQRFQNEYSTLSDAYKKAELFTETGLAMFTLSSIPVDKAEPSESLMATVAWSNGLIVKKYLLSSRQLDEFRMGKGIVEETDVRANRGAYFIGATIDLSPNLTKDWIIVAEVYQDTAAVINLNSWLEEKNGHLAAVEADIETGSNNLLEILASADGLQHSNDPKICARHLSNVLFNVMRGGYFSDQYRIGRDDFMAFVEVCNTPEYKAQLQVMQQWPETLTPIQLEGLCADAGSAALTKLALEYLPLTFSRRHGDPSRPWNKFSIDVKDDRGHKKLNYEGNWRDIFQNWEALAFSFPDFLESMITKFVNATTADGYNPYRVMRDGFDWEVIDPLDPWSYIGYWGDHQIIYLLKLLELSGQMHPGKLETLLHQDHYTYANVPYRQKTYAEMLRDPRDTIVYDAQIEADIARKVADIGTDGKFLFNRDGGVYFVNLAEKILVPLLTKLSNFIPEAGIWMNTQRPEWNDANNALVGNGASMVTLYYMRRHLQFCATLFSRIDNTDVQLSSEVADFLNAVYGVLRKHKALLVKGFTGQSIKQVMDAMGTSGEQYRNQIYSEGFTGTRVAFPSGELAAFCRLAQSYMEQSIVVNRRNDHLYHTYNLVDWSSGNSVTIDRLDEMLEGQVAVLSSGYLPPKETIEVLKALRSSRLYREDQHSYMLYPDRQLPLFLEKNNLPADALNGSELLRLLVKKGDRQVVIRDNNGILHFSGALRNAADLEAVLDEIDDADLVPLIAAEKDHLLGIFEGVFKHRKFTGRSGTFYKYEGLGSIYWHMVSKLLLAVQENYHWTQKSDYDASILDALKHHFYDIWEGIGVHKSPPQYGAFSTDPYSHTPLGFGAQQPGMTGQVKEDIISRFAMLGVVFAEGQIHFRPGLLQADEFLQSAADFAYIDVHNKRHSIALAPGSLAFTLAQVPVAYHRANHNRIVVTTTANETFEHPETKLTTGQSHELFSRSGSIRQIEVYFSF
jgi:hypothetical protein